MIRKEQICISNMFRQLKFRDKTFSEWALGWILAKYDRPCIAYSFGVSRDLTFDDELAETYHCSVFFFDPTTAFSTYQHAPTVWFYRLGIGSKYEKSRLAMLRH